MQLSMLCIQKKSLEFSKIVNFLTQGSQDCLTSNYQKRTPLGCLTLSYKQKACKACYCFFSKIRRTLLVKLKISIIPPSKRLTSRSMATCISPSKGLFYLGICIQKYVRRSFKKTVMYQSKSVWLLSVVFGLILDHQ